VCAAIKKKPKKTDETSWRWSSRCAYFSCNTPWHQLDDINKLDINPDDINPDDNNPDDDNNKLDNANKLENNPDDNNPDDDNNNWRF